MKDSTVRKTASSRVWLGAMLLLMTTAVNAQTKKSTPAPAPKAVAPASHPAVSGAHPMTPGVHPGATNTAARPGAPGATGNRFGTNTAHPTGPGGAAGQHQVVRNANGTSSVRTADGRQFNKAPNGRVTSFQGANGHAARFDNAGRVREVHGNGVTVVHGPGGARRAVVERPGHTMIVANGRGHTGYVQHPYMYRGHAYFHRTYYRNGVRYSRVYRPYYYHGVYLHGYVPYRYYAPAYYGWVAAPWAAPVYYQWGWAGSPWYGYYGGYFTPYPVYASPSLWLTDYVLATSLQEAYQEQQDAAAAAAAGAPGQSADMSMDGGGMPQPPPNSATMAALTPEVKQELATEVQRDVEFEKSMGQTAGGQAGAQDPGADQTSGGLAQLLSDGQPHVFIAGATLNVNAGAQDCAITEGDVLQLNQAPPLNATSANLVVLASKGQDCRQGSNVSVAFADLQEMQNHMMAAIDQGLGEMQSNAGKNGLPTPPAAAMQAPADAAYAAAAPPPDPNTAAELAQAAQQATQEEQAVLSEAAPPPDIVAAAQVPAPGPGADSYAAAPPSAGPITIALGQTPAQVMAAKGSPRQIVNLGAKQIYVYPDMKIIFVGGKVSDVQ